MAIRSVYAKDVSDLRHKPGAPVRIDGIDEVRKRVSDAMGRARRADGLREHQTEALTEMARHFAEGHNRSLVVIPAVGDQRQIFPTAIGALGGAKVGGSSWFPNTVVLTPTIDAIGRTLRELRAARPDIAVGYMASKSVMDDNGKPVPAAFGLVTVMTYAGFIEYARREAIRPGDIDLLVMADAHQGLSNTRQEILTPFLNTAVVTAFTGTPAFDDFKSVHRLLGLDSEVYSISAQKLRDRGVISPISNYVMAVQIKGEEPLSPAKATLAKRKALVDEVLDFLESAEKPEVVAAVESRTTMFYGADIAHANMFAAEFDKRYRAANALAEMVRYRKEFEKSTGKPHDRARSMLRTEMLEALVEHRVEDEGGWFRVSQALRVATQDKALHLEALIERVATMSTPMEVLTGEQSAAHVAKVMDRVRKGEVRYLANAQLLDGIEVPNVGVVINTPTDSLLHCLYQGAHAQRTGKTGFVINPYYEVNGLMEGFPRFFYEASGDLDMGWQVETNIRYCENVDVDDYEPEPEPVRAPATVRPVVTAAAPALTQPVAPVTAVRPPVAVVMPPAGPGRVMTGAAAAPVAAAGSGRQAAPESWKPNRVYPAAKGPGQAAPASRPAPSLFTDTKRFKAAKPAAFQPAAAPRPAPKYRHEPKPQMKPAVEPRRPTITHNVDAIIRLMKRRDAYRKALPPDPAYLSKRDACARLAVPSSQSGQIFRAYRLAEEALLHGEAPKHGERVLDVERFQDGPMRYLGMRVDDVDAIGHSLGYYPNLPAKSADWMTVSEVGRAIGSTGHPLVAKIFQDLAEEWTATGKAKANGFSLVREGTRRVFALHRSELDWFRQEFTGRRPAAVKPGEVTLNNACFRLSIPVSANAKALWAAAIEAVDTQCPVDEDENVPFRKAMDGGREIGVLGERGLPWLARKLGVRYHGVIAYESAFHATVDDAIVTLGLTGSQAAEMSGAYDRLRAAHGAGRPVIVDGDQVSASEVRVRGGTMFVLPRDCLNALASELKLAVPKPQFGEIDEPEHTPSMGI